MNRVKKILFGTLIALLLFGGIGTAFAWGSPQNRGVLPKAYGIASGYFDGVDLNLSEEQVKKLQDLSLKYQKEMLELRNALQVKQLELRTLLLSKEPDQDKINSMVEEIGKLRTDIQKKALDYQIQMRKIFTPEQWDKLYSYRWNKRLCFPRFHCNREWGKDRVHGRRGWDLFP